MNFESNPHFKVIPTNNLSHAEWLDLRRKGIGGSDLAGIMGMSSWATPIDIYLDKTWQSPTEDEENPMFWWGNKLEPLIIERYCLTYPMEKIIQAPGMLRSKKWPFMAVNLDGIIYQDNLPGVAELKTAAFPDKEWGPDGGNEEDIPEKYFCQVAHSLAVTGFKYAVLIVLFMASREMRRYFIHRDEAVIKNIVSFEDNFWKENVLKEEPPTPTNTDDCNKLWMWDKGTTVTANDDIVLASEELRNVKAEVKRLEGTDGKGGRRSELEAKIKGFMKENLVLLGPDGRKVCSWKSQTSRIHDTKRFALEQPKMDEEYRKDSTSRVFRFK